MLIFGLGLTKSHWKKIFQSIQAPLKPHVISARLLSPREIEPQTIISTCQHLSQTPPALALITPRGFETLTDCLFFLSQMQLNLVSKQTCYGLIVENLSDDLAPFLSYSPQIMTHCKKMMTLREQSLLVDKAQKFPYFSASEVKLVQIKYKNSSGIVVNQSLAQLPKDELIALTQIQQVLLGQKSFSIYQWLEYALQKRGQELLKPHVKGILRDSQGVSFSGGLAIENLESLKLGDLCLDFILSYHALFPQNQTFQKMIETLKSQIHVPQKEVLIRKSVRCMGTIKIINQIAEQILAKKGFQDIQMIDELAHGTHTLEETLIWIQFNPFPHVKLIGQKYDFVKDIQRIVKQVNAFIPLEQLKVHDNFAKINPTDFQNAMQRLHQKEQKLLDAIKQIESRLLILTQEKELFQICEEKSSFLQKQLTDAKLLENSNDEGLESVVLFTSEYQQVGKKTIWIDPYEYREAEDLRQFPLERIQRNIEGGMMIAEKTAKFHLIQLCQKAQDHFQLCQQSLDTQQTELEVLHKQIEQLQDEKNTTAIQWIDSSLQKLLQFEENI